MDIFEEQRKYSYPNSFVSQCENILSEGNFSNVESYSKWSCNKLKNEQDLLNWGSSYKKVDKYSINPLKISPYYKTLNL